MKKLLKNIPLSKLGDSLVGNAPKAEESFKNAVLLRGDNACLVVETPSGVSRTNESTFRSLAFPLLNAKRDFAELSAECKQLESRIESLSSVYSDGASVRLHRNRATTLSSFVGLKTRSRPYTATLRLKEKRIPRIRAATTISASGETALEFGGSVRNLFGFGEEISLLGLPAEGARSITSKLEYKQPVPVPQGFRNGVLHAERNAGMEDWSHSSSFAFKKEQLEASVSFDLLRRRDNLPFFVPVGRGTLGCLWATRNRSQESPGASETIRSMPKSIPKVSLTGSLMREFSLTKLSLSSNFEFALPILSSIGFAKMEMEASRIWEKLFGVSSLRLSTTSKAGFLLSGAKIPFVRSLESSPSSSSLESSLTTTSFDPNASQTPDRNAALVLDSFYPGSSFSLRGLSTSLLCPKCGEDSVGTKIFAAAAAALTFPVVPAAMINDRSTTPRVLQSIISNIRARAFVSSLTSPSQYGQYSPLNTRVVAGVGIVFNALWAAFDVSLLRQLKKYPGDECQRISISLASD